MLRKSSFKIDMKDVSWWMSIEEAYRPGAPITTKFSKERNVATPLWPSVGVKPNTSKVGDLESFGTPECLEFNSKAQNTSHWGVLAVIGKGLEA
jgi:hypothetical protein